MLLSIAYFLILKSFFKLDYRFSKDKLVCQYHFSKLTNLNSHYQPTTVASQRKSYSKK